MKKRLAILVAIVLVLATVLTVAVACDTTKVVKSLDFVNPQKNYKVGDEIDYDNLKVKITYTDNSTEEKTVKQLVDDGAVLTKADLSKEGNPVIKLVYKEAVAQVTLTVTANSDIDPDIKETIVAFTAPDFYTTYTTNSANRTGTTEERRDFRITGAPYEVGTANKFIFRPIVKALDLEGSGDEVEVINPKTLAKVYAKESVSGQYTELTGEALTNFVTVDNNTYKFAGKTEQKYVKLEITLDSSKYTLTQLPTAEQTITVEFMLIEDGYNAYDQMGLSVMADLEKRAWSEIWKCDTTVEGNVVKCVATADSVKLLADDKPLCEYVDMISTVILHNTITLDPDGMPSIYFWKESDVLFEETQASLEAHKVAQANLVGTLRSGDNSGVITDSNYMRVIDVNGGDGIELGFNLNMQRSLFATKHVSVSGNYQRILTPKKGGERPESKRVLEIYADWDDTAVSDPLSHWAVFQMLQSKIEGAEKADFEIRNIAMQGNNPREKITGSDGLTSAGLMLLDTYTTSLSINNVNASQFFNMMNGDDYGTITFKDGKVDSNGESEDAILNVTGAKMYDSYSNMVYLWRSTATIKNSEMIGSGGPLFILCDGTRTISENPGNTDESGPEFEVDSLSTLQAYAYGGESWYATWNATPLFTALGQQIEPALNAFGKSMYVESAGGHDYINAIAILICSPGELFSGNGATNKNNTVDVRGKFTQLGDNGNTYEMHNDLLVALRDYSFLAQQNATACAPILQVGDVFFGLKNSSTAIVYDAEGTEAMPGTGIMIHVKEVSIAEVLPSVMGTKADKLCIYMSAAPMAGALPNGSVYAPYFGIVLDLVDKK